MEEQGKAILSGGAASVFSRRQHNEKVDLHRLKVVDSLRSSGSNSAVECQLPKLDVAGSIPVSRSFSFKSLGFTSFGSAALLPHSIHKSGFQCLNSLKSAVQRCLSVGVQIDIKIVTHGVGNDFGIHPKLTHQRRVRSA